MFVGQLEQVVKRLCGCSPSKRLSGPGVEGGRHGGNRHGAVRAEIAALREVLTQQPVGVLVAAALPRAVRRDYQNFRVWGRTMLLKEPSYAGTQTAFDPG
jgi:hypothetical protein